MLARRRRRFAPTASLWEHTRNTGGSGSCLEMKVGGGQLGLFARLGRVVFTLVRLSLARGGAGLLPSGWAASCFQLAFVLVPLARINSAHSQSDEYFGRGSVYRPFGLGQRGRARLHSGARIGTCPELDQT